MKTHQVVDFGPGPLDHTQGYPFEGTEEECGEFVTKANAEHPRSDSPRFAVQIIPEDETFD